MFEELIKVHLVQVLLEELVFLLIDTVTAELLGFDGIVENSIDATSTRDFVAEYVAMISILMTNLSKISEDFVIWSTSEFSFIELSDEFTSPSSVMPQKKNPDILELTRGKTAEVIGNLNFNSYNCKRSCQLVMVVIYNK